MKKIISIINNLLAKNKSSYNSEIQSEKSSKECSLLLRSERLKCDMTLKDLEMKTKISAHIIESLEMGWFDKLPEKAYLIRMLLTLEKELGLPTSSLNGILLEARSIKKEPIKSYISSENINFFRSWQISLFYFIAILISILFINHTQEKISINNYKSIMDIKASTKKTKELNPNKELVKNTQSKQEIINNKISIYQRIKTLIISRFQVKEGILKMELSDNYNISIKSSGGYSTNIENGTGKFEIKLSPPVIIRLIPELTEKDNIFWNNYRLISEENNGEYLIGR